MNAEALAHEVWRIHLFGGLRVVYRDRTILHSPSPKVGLLLARLAIDRYEVHPREELIEMLWPDEDSEITRVRFRQVLTTLRRDLSTAGAFVDDLLLSDRTNVRLNPVVYTTDVETFEAAIRSAQTTGSPAERAAVLKQAEEQYSGELLRGYYEDWVMQERERLAEAHMQMLSQLVEALANTGDLEAAITFGRKAVMADPLREECYCDLMRLLGAADRISEGLRLYEALKQKLWKELRVVPSERARQLMEALRSPSPVGTPGTEPAPLDSGGDTITSAGTVPVRSTADGSESPGSTLPAPLTRFFGRGREIDDLVQALSPAPAGAHGPNGAENTGVRLVTLVGPGGCGKTRLGLETARRLVGPYRGAVWFVRVSSGDDNGQFTSALAAALCPQREASSRDLLDQIHDAVGEREGLLVLDNFEQVVAEGAHVVLRLLERSHGLRCLITSRQRLNVEGEVEYGVMPLPLPEEIDAPERLLACSSVRLFVDRAQKVRSDFTLTSANAAAIVALCRRLEGIPLALELAAAWASVLTPAQILERLSQRFDLLVSRRTDLEERHRSLRATISWSYEQLPEELQRLFCRLSVFQGGWTLEAADAICNDRDETGQIHPLDALEQLRERSFVMVEHTGETVRFRMLDTLREFTSVQLQDQERQRLCALHGRYYLALAEQAYQQLVGPEQVHWLQLLDADHDNFRAVLAWSVSPEGDVDVGLRLFGALWRFWDVRCNLLEAEQWWAKLSANRPLASAAAWARGLEGAGCLAVGQDQDEIGQRRLEECVALYRLLGDAQGMAHTLCMQAVALRDMGDVAAARPLFEECLAIFQSSNDVFGTGRALAGLGAGSMREGDFSTARTHLEKAASLYRICGHVRGLAWCTHTEGYVARGQGDYGAARTCFQDSLALYRALEDGLWTMGSLYNLALLAQIEGDLTGAQAYGEEALGIARRIHSVQWEAGCLVFLGDLAAQRQEAALADAWYRDGLARTEHHDVPGSRRSALIGLARLAAARGQHERAIRLFGAASSIGESRTSAIPWEQPVDFSADLAALQAAVGEEGYAVALARGRTMTSELVMRAALADD